MFDWLRGMDEKDWLERFPNLNKVISKDGKSRAAGGLGYLQIKIQFQTVAVFLRTIFQYHTMLFWCSQRRQWNNCAYVQTNGHLLVKVSSTNFECIF